MSKREQTNKTKQKIIQSIKQKDDDKYKCKADYCGRQTLKVVHGFMWNSCRQRLQDKMK